MKNEGSTLGPGPSKKEHALRHIFSPYSQTFLTLPQINSWADNGMVLGKLPPAN